MTIENHFGINVLRDDLLPGGTKSVILPGIITDPSKEYVYASPVYGGFQIALALYCQLNKIRCTIFCAKRKIRHQNTLRCIEAGANVLEIPFGYLSVIEKASRDYCEKYGAIKIEFGAKTDYNIYVLSHRVKDVIKAIGREPEQIWCAVGSGMLVESILKGTTKARVHGVCVGAHYDTPTSGIKYRLTLHEYPKPFEYRSLCQAPFPSMPNYDLKAWELCSTKGTGDILFWNVL